MSLVPPSRGKPLHHPDPCGPEIAVASTKAYSVQLSISISSHPYRNGAQPYLRCRSRSAHRQLLQTNCQNKGPLECNDTCRTFPSTCAGEDLFFIGRGLDYNLSQRGRSSSRGFLHSQRGYASGELKHGTISLIPRTCRHCVATNTLC
jgi:glucosamine--fructose-6-phosphate aminotransferase (isomerizing)